MQVFYTVLAVWHLLVLACVTAVTEEELQKQYCCYLSEEELSDMVGIHPSCPTGSAGVIPGTTEGDKCDTCPPGTCRVRSNQIFAWWGCVCAKDFVNYYSSGLYPHRNGCKTNYGKAWPASVGVPNLSLRSCVTTTEAPTSSPTCGKQCVNGIFEPDTCSCQCPTRFQGDVCDECDQHYFGLPNCQFYCKASETCSGGGVCADDGRSCVCNAGRFGKDCSCVAQNCAAADVACSGNGSCTDSECTCNAGFTGCACELECSDATTCSGHGTCRTDASCECDEGYIGADCATLDLSTYCSSGRTVSGNPCLPGVVDILGYGYDAIKGSKTIPVSVLTFTEGRVVTIEGNTYEIPDNVQCSPVTLSESGFFTSSFKSTKEFRRHKAYSVGLSGEMNSPDKGGYMSGSREYETIFRRSFGNERHLFSSDLNHGLYSCALSDNAPPTVTPAVTQSLQTFTGDRLVEKVGTHYIQEVTFGGKLSVFTFVDSCVLATESAQTIRNEIDGSVYWLASAASAEGSFTSTTTKGNACSAFASNSFYLKTVYGGRRQRLILPEGATNIADFHEWFDTIMGLPSPIQFDKIEHIDVIVPEITTAIVQDYVGQFEPTEVESPSGVAVECAVPAGCGSGATMPLFLTAKMITAGLSVSMLLLS